MEEDKEADAPGTGPAKREPPLSLRSRDGVRSPTMPVPHVATGRGWGIWGGGVALKGGGVSKLGSNPDKLWLVKTKRIPQFLCLQGGNTF